MTTTSYFILVFALVIYGTSADQGCSEDYGLNDTCAARNSKTSFYCLIDKTKDVFWEYQPINSKPKKIAINEEVVNDDSLEKYGATTLYKNATHSCSQLVVNVGEDDVDGDYYHCKFGEEQKSAKLRITNLKSNDLTATIELKESGYLYRDHANISIAANVSGFYGIPGLQLKLYVNDTMVEEVPVGILDCTNATFARLTYTKTFDEGQPNLLSIKLAYAHMTFTEDKILFKITHVMQEHQTDVPDCKKWIGLTVTSIVVTVVVFLGICLWKKIKTFIRKKCTNAGKEIDQELQDKTKPILNINGQDRDDAQNTDAGANQHYNLIDIAEKIAKHAGEEELRRLANKLDIGAADPDYMTMKALFFIQKWTQERRKPLYDPEFVCALESMDLAEVVCYIEDNKRT